MTTFAELRLSTPLLEAIARLGYDKPTPIQEQTIPALLDGRDVIGQAQTGTGKTAAFGLPLLDYIDVSDREVQALVLTPTRELCIQVTQALRAYGSGLGIEVVAVFGGAPIRSQVSQLKAGGQVVVGTVGRVMDLMNRHELVLSSARYVVLDEADEMLDLGFLEDVEKILLRCPAGRQTALFSATMPAEIRKLAESRMFDPQMIKVRAATLTIDTVNQYYVQVPDRGKAEALVMVLKKERPDQAIIFARTKIGVDRLARSLSTSGVRVKALHGDMSQGSRDGVMISFKEGRERLLVATDIAARGLDISGVTHVVNYDMPNSPDVYVHRIGRTGRVGRTGTAITLVTDKQQRELEAIEKHANTKIHPWSETGNVPAPKAPEAVEVEAPAQVASAPELEAPAAQVASAPELEAPAAEVASAPDIAAPAANGAAPEAPRERPRRRRRSTPLAPANGADAAESIDPAAAPADRADAAGGVEATDAPALRANGAAAPSGAGTGEAVADAPSAAGAVAPEAPLVEVRRPRHTKPRKGEGPLPAGRIIVAAGRAHGVEPADVIGAVVDHSRLDGEDIRVRTLERFSIIEVPEARAGEVVEQVRGHRLRGRELRLEVLSR